MTVPLWTYHIIIALFSLVITLLLFLRWKKGKDRSLLYWGSGFLAFAFSYFLSSLFIAGSLPDTGFMYTFLHFIRQSLVSVFFIFVYLGITILVTKKRFWRRAFPLAFLILQLFVTAWFDFLGGRILLAENLHIFLFDIPFNIVICVLFMRYFLISGRRFSIIQSIAWLGYVVLVSIGFGIEFSALFYTISLLPMLLMLVGFVDYYRRPLTEHILEITPKIESVTSGGPPKYKLELGKVHLVKEQKPHKSYDMFIDHVLHKVYGLAISRSNPEIVKSNYGLKQTPLIWLTRIETEHAYLNPVELEQLTFAVTDFMDKVGNNKSVILLEGLEYLTTSNEFTKVLHAISMIKDKVSGTNSIVILPVDPKALPKQNITMLEKELE
ncbi:MAG: DUF835 domain-containing protein [Nanoarchaeota archaeon]|nr:DUF835 domain-containing protein [Nanoarchaeota archaeon]